MVAALLAAAQGVSALCLVWAFVCAAGVGAGGRSCCLKHWSSLALLLEQQHAEAGKWGASVQGNWPLVEVLACLQITSSVGLSGVCFLEGLPARKQVCKKGKAPL